MSTQGYDEDLRFGRSYVAGLDARLEAGRTRVKGEHDVASRGQEGTLVEFGTARVAAGDLILHSLPHSYATWLVDDGVPVNMVPQVIGGRRRPWTSARAARRV